MADQQAFNKTLVLGALRLPPEVVETPAARTSKPLISEPTRAALKAHARTFAVGLGAALMGIAVVTWTHELKTATAHAARPPVAPVRAPMRAVTVAEAKPQAPAQRAVAHEAESNARALPPIVIRARTPAAHKRAAQAAKNLRRNTASTGYERISVNEVVQL